MAVNPLDLQQMQPPSGRWGQRSYDVVTKYASGQVIASPIEAQPGSTTSSGGGQ
jgi:hypothetical protein